MKSTHTLAGSVEACAGAWCSWNTEGTGTPCILAAEVRDTLCVCDLVKPCQVPKLRECFFFFLLHSFRVLKTSVCTCTFSVEVVFVDYEQISVAVSLFADSPALLNTFLKY